MSDATEVCTDPRCDRSGYHMATDCDGSGIADLDALTAADVVALQTAEEHGHAVTYPAPGSILDQLGTALQEVERLRRVETAAAALRTAVRDQVQAGHDVSPRVSFACGQLRSAMGELAGRSLSEQDAR